MRAYKCVSHAYVMIAVCRGYMLAYNFLGRPTYQVVYMHAYLGTRGYKYTYCTLGYDYTYVFMHAYLYFHMITVFSNQNRI